MKHAPTPLEFDCCSDDYPSWVLVTHLFNHQTHHRGQLTTLLSQLGYDYSTTDLPWLANPLW